LILCRFGGCPDGTRRIGIERRSIEIESRRIGIEKRPIEIESRRIGIERRRTRIEIEPNGIESRLAGLGHNLRESLSIGVVAVTVVVQDFVGFASSFRAWVGGNRTIHEISDIGSA
jgi:hypothetical protein